MHIFFEKKISSWILPLFLILFLLEVVTLPLVFGITYSGRSEGPDHVLTYTPGELTWDSATGNDEDGAANLNIYDAVYDNVASANGENVVAPGTEGYNIVRLKNDVSGIISYTAVLYHIRTNEELPVETALLGEGFEDTDIYPLPDGVRDEQVIRAVKGTMYGDTIQDFDISWLWRFEVNDEQNIKDTWFGDQGDLDDITVGLYIVVEDTNHYADKEEQEENSNYINPDIPHTGDDSPIGMYLALMLISMIVLILLIVDRRREKSKCRR